MQLRRRYLLGAILGGCLGAFFGYFRATERVLLGARATGRQFTPTLLDLFSPLDWDQSLIEYTSSESHDNMIV